MSPLKINDPKYGLWPFFSNLFCIGAFFYTILGMWFHYAPEVMITDTISREELYMGLSAGLLALGIICKIVKENIDDDN